MIGDAIAVAYVLYIARASRPIVMTPRGCLPWPNYMVFRSSCLSDVVLSLIASCGAKSILSYAVCVPLTSWKSC